MASVKTALAGERHPKAEMRFIVRKAMAYMHAHYMDAISRQDVARHASVSEGYLNRCFKQELGLAPLAYLNRYRINQAKVLLTAGRGSVTEIALATGFANINYFSRIFRKVVGVSPRAYRRRQGKSD